MAGAILFGGIITIKLNSIAHSPQSTSPSGQTLFMVSTSTNTASFPSQFSTPTALGTILQIFNENGTWFWILTGTIVLFVVLRYVKALTMQEVSQ